MLTAEGKGSKADAEIKFRALFDATRDAVMLLDEKGFFECNAATLRLFGCRSQEEFCAKHPADFSPPQQPDGRDSFAASAAHITTAMEKGEDHFEWIHRRMDGTDFYADVLLSATNLNQRKILQALVRDITEQKQLLLELRKLSRAVEQSPAYIVITDLEGTIEYVNPKFTTVTGYTSAEAVGQNPRILKSGRHPAEFYEELWRTISSGREWHGEFCNKRKNGEIYWESASISPVRDERGMITNYLAVKEDITKRKETEKALRDSEEKFKTLFQSAAEGILVADLETMKFNYANPAICKMLKYDEAALMKLGVSDIYPPEKLEKIVAEFNAQALGEKTFAPNIPCICGDGSVIHANISTVPVEMDGRKCNVGFFTDITHQKNLEMQLNQAQKLEAVGRLAAGIAHEINTPIQFVGDNIRFLQDAFKDLLAMTNKCGDLFKRALQGGNLEELAAEAKKVKEEADWEYLQEEIPHAVEQSLNGLERVSGIVRSMKEFAHPGTTEKTAVNLNRAIENTLTVARNEWKYVAEAVTDFDPALPPVPCLPGDFNQVILNLVVNAAHAVGEVVGDGSNGKGVITVKTGHDGDWAEIRIADTGCGIPEENLNKIFQPFFTTKEVGKGTGQGLAMVYHTVVEKHDGTVKVESEVGKGTTFIIRLPLNADRPR